MNSRGKERKHNYIRKCALAFALIFLLGSVVIPLNAYAYDEVTEVSVTVGFWGEEEYVKDEISLSTLASACGTHREIYTWISNGSSPGTTEAEGIYILDILDYLGVDTGSVECLNFYTRDAATYTGSTQQWTTGQLFGSRYSFSDCFLAAVEDYNDDREDYMKNPESHYTINDIYDFSNKKYSNDAWNNRYRVEPMLALKTRSATWKGYTPASSLNFSGLASNGKPILIFGQAGKNDITRNLMAQMVTKIHVWYEGSPDIRLESTDTEGKVGDTKVYNLTIATPDDFLSEKVADKVKVESSDESIAKVNEDGTITITGEGSVQLNAVYNGKTYSSITITGKGEEDEGEGSGEGSGSSEGSGDGSSSGANTGEGAGTGSDTNNSQGSGDSTSNQKKNNTSNKTNSVSLKNDNNTAKAQQQGSAGGAASGSGDNKIKVYTISEAEGVYVERETSKGVAITLILLGALSVGLGTVAEVFYFRSQVYWIEKAKRIYEKS